MLVPLRSGALSSAPLFKHSWLFPILLPLVMVGCKRPLTGRDCSALLERYVALLAASDRPETSATERTHMQELAKEKAAHDPEFDTCGRSVSRDQFDCAMVASNTDDFERCLM